MRVGGTPCLAAASSIANRTTLEAIENIADLPPSYASPYPRKCSSSQKAVSPASARRFNSSVNDNAITLQ